MKGAGIIAPLWSSHAACKFLRFSPQNNKEKERVGRRKGGDGLLMRLVKNDQYNLPSFVVHTELCLDAESMGI